MSSSENLPEIPKGWNLTAEQRASMIERQKKVIEEDNKKRSLQQISLNTFNQHASMKPPEYPILVTVKENNQIVNSFYLTDKSNNYVYANSFNVATIKVKNDLISPNSILQQKYGKSTKLRISSDNKNNGLQNNNFSLIPNSNFKQWVIATTNAAPSLMSSFRKTTSSLPSLMSSFRKPTQSRGGRKIQRRTRRLKKNAKSKSKPRYNRHKSKSNKKH